MVVASIWFFFWAKNGGFVWRQGDWDDYKSTVLRRKDKDGKTLSNATKSTKLGQKSIAGTFSDYGENEKYAGSDYGYHGVGGRKKKSRPHGGKSRQPIDDDMLAYRHEKPAVVGGLNGEADGSHWDYTNTDRSDLSSKHSAAPLRPKPASPKKKGFMEKKREKKEEREREKEKEKRQRKAASKSRNNVREEHLLGHRDSTIAPSIIAPSTIAYTEESYVSDHYYDKDDSYYNAYRPPTKPYAEGHYSPRRQSPHRQSPHNSRPNSANHQRQSSRPSSANHQRQPSTIKKPSRPHSSYAYSEAGTTDTGTRGYPHYIPELGPRGGRDAGYRRDAFGGRRDSLSDSDGDDGDLGSRRY